MDNLQDLIRDFLTPKNGLPSLEVTPLLPKYRPVLRAPLWFNPEEAPVPIEQQFTKVFPVVQSWAKDEGQARMWPGLLIHGPLGCGKTGLALLLGHRSGRRSEFVTVSELVRSIKETWGQLATEQESEVIRRWMVPDMLIVDEIGGVQFGTPAERNAIYDVVVGRYNRCKPTVLTTNCNLNKPEGRQEFYECVGARVADRFQGYTLDAWGWGPSLRGAK